MGEALSSGQVAHSFDLNRAQNVVKRFLAYNQNRLDRTQEAFTDRQRLFLAVLPILYHVNHEKLPGFIDHDCPCGVARYAPDKDGLRAASTVAIGFQYQQRRSGHPAIRSLFLMGSCGSLGHSGGSDLDIWLCHSPFLPEEQIALLEKKALEIEKWGDSLGLEVHFFLMDADRFRRGERNDLSGEDCGSAQHQLLLDEFYRTSILVAGCYPTWWLVPPEHEPDYDQYTEWLESKGYINPEEAINFGGVSHIPAGEFIGAGMWQLYKAIGSPYKSILKLMLTECYASTHPDIHTVSMDLKRDLYDESRQIDRMDPYLLLLDRLEAYLLEREELDRLELIRRCIYFKANIQMSQSVRSKHWKRQFLKPLLKDWDWSDGLLKHLDNRAQWQVHTVLEERKLLVNELIHSYKFLSQFSRHHQQESLLNSRDMSLLGNKLYATFDRKPGKIDFINPSISRDIQEEKLSLHLHRQHVKQRIPKHTWSLYTGAARPDTGANAIKKSQSLIEILTWSHVNEVMGKGTNIAMYQGRQHVNDYEIREIINTLQQLPALSSIEPHFENPPVPKLVYLYVNVFVDPMSHYTRRGIHKISNQTDSLGYSAMRENLVLTIDQLVFNTWREVITTRYEGEHALLRVIEDFLKGHSPKTQSAPPELKVFCFCATRPIAIADRVSHVLKEIIDCFFHRRHGTRARYVLEVSHHYHVIQYSNGRPVIYHFDKASHMLKKLSRPQPYYSQIILDSQALKGTVIKLICEHSAPGRLHVYYLRRDREAHVYVLDERGSLIHWLTPMYNEAALINPLNHFLRQIEYRQNRQLHSEQVDAEHAADEDTTPVSRERIIEFFEVQLPSKELPLRSRPIRPKEGLGQGRYFDVRAEVDYDANNKVSFTLFCEDEEFSQFEHGEQVYKQLVRHLVKLRQHAKPYPVYITDLSIADRLQNSRHPLQTVTYLEYKHKLESRLNQALHLLYPSQPNPSA